MPDEHPAYRLARELLAQLAPACDRIMIAGSLRRQKPEPKDIELCCIPSLGVYEVRDMFDLVSNTHVVNRLTDLLATFIHPGGPWQYDTETPRNGEKYKRLRHVTSGICCDLFITDVRRWGYTFTVRTGPAEFSHALVTRALHQHRFFRDGLLHAHAPEFEMKQGKREAKPCPQGDACPHILETPDEPALFAGLGLDYIEPTRRSQADPRTIMQGK